MTVPRSYAKAGGRSSAATREITSQSSGTFKSPFDVLKPDFKREEVPKAERTVTSQGTVRVQFVEKPKVVSRSAKSDAARAPKFNRGDHPLDLEVAERLSTLPARRHEK